MPSPSRRLRVASIALVLVALPACTRKPVAPEDPVKVAAASDLTFAFDALGKSFEAKSGRKLIFSFGASGQLAKQIGNGAPFDLFAAANVGFVDDVVQAGACDGATRKPYAQGHLVIWSPVAGTVTSDTLLTDLTGPKFARIAIANPERAPYGQAARQALTAAGVWDAVQPKLVYAENIKETMQLAESGRAEVALVALSLALGSKHGRYASVDPALHQPLEQTLVVCKHGDNAAGAQAFADYLSSPEGRAAMARFGFVLPGEGGAR